MTPIAIPQDRPHLMLPQRFLTETLLLCLLLLSCAGCSSLGLSCFPTGHYLTKQAEGVVDRSPRAAQIPRELEQGVIPAHFLQPGDVLLIEPVDMESDVRIPADQTVLIDGSIDLGAFGRILVAGLTLEMAENVIERTIVEAGHEETRVNVRLLEPMHRYYVLGEVNSPGSYPLDGHETVLDGILTAGGLTSSAAPCKILLTRPTPPSSCRITLPICYREITQLGDTSTNYQIQPGDRIFVASRTWCEELMFWQASKVCARCCNCQTACVDPAVIGFSNPVTQVSGTLLASEASADDSSGSSPPHSTGSSSKVAAAVHESIASAMDREEDQTGLEKAPPARLPSPSDGELDFGPTESSARFEPLWITSASVAEPVEN